MKQLDYAIIGNCTSGALISKKGSINFLCLPHFNSATTFASLLDKKKGGSFKIEVSSTYTITQQYLENTNILITSYKQKNNQFDVYDFMPRYKLSDNTLYHPPELVRYIRHVSGKPKIKICYNPKLEYAQGKTTNNIYNNYIKSTTKNNNYESIYLYSSLNLSNVATKKNITITKNEFLLINYNQKLLPITMDYIYMQYVKTKTYWIEWVSMTHKVKPYEELVVRSLLTLKLLTFEKTGALLAALTTSLPETIGEVRNWDYRFCWIRDAAMTASVFHQMGQTKMANNFIEFILNVTPFKHEQIQVLYDISGNKTLDEKILKHLSGYENSKPVRIGNAAYSQLQLDIYGFLMDIIHTSLNNFYTNLDKAEKLWTMVRGLVRFVESNWQKKDSGPWEFREKLQHFVFSKVLCWVALDRAIKIATTLKQTDYIKEWQQLKQTIKEDIYSKGWNNKIGSFMQSYDSPYFDATNLLLEQYGFLEANNPKFISTVEKTHDALCENGLMLRYNCIDDFGKPSSSFFVCCLWMVDALHKIGKKDLAKTYFDTLLTYKNHVGLYSEDIDKKTGFLLGNFPQAYSHLALISTCLTLSNQSLYNPNSILHNIRIE